MAKLSTSQRLVLSQSLRVPGAVAVIQELEAKLREEAVGRVLSYCSASPPDTHRALQYAAEARAYREFLAALLAEIEGMEDVSL